MSWILWTILLSLGCIFVVFLLACLWVAKEADEKIDQFGPSLNIIHERLKENTHVGIHTRFHKAKIDGSKSASLAVETGAEAKESELFCK